MEPCLSAHLKSASTIRCKVRVESLQSCCEAAEEKVLLEEGIDIFEGFHW